MGGGGKWGVGGRGGGKVGGGGKVWDVGVMREGPPTRQMAGEVGRERLQKALSFKPLDKNGEVPSAHDSTCERCNDNR
uniref:Uncharacterized protein n=1 Tax=Knipowitschia caucasica TaxID=637954 RepID=A0AAV2JHF7_KNICA